MLSRSLSGQTAGVTRKPSLDWPDRHCKQQSAERGQNLRVHSYLVETETYQQTNEEVCAQVLEINKAACVQEELILDKYDGHTGKASGRTQII